MRRLNKEEKRLKKREEEKRLKSDARHRHKQTRTSIGRQMSHPKVSRL
jgi:hypothetical protein